MRVLFVTSRFPYPLYRGDQLRAYNQIMRLSRSHKVTLLCFGPPEARKLAPELWAACEHIELVEWSRATAVWELVRSGITGLPWRAALFRSARFERTLQSLLARSQYDVVHIQLLAMCTYASRISAAAEEWVRSTFDWDASVASLENLYRRALLAHRESVSLPASTAAFRTSRSNVRT